MNVILRRPSFLQRFTRTPHRLGPRVTSSAPRTNGAGALRWRAAADIATLALLALALSVAYFGGFRERIGDVRISMTSWERLLLLAGAVATLRHAASWHEPLPVIAWRWIRAATGADAFRAAWPAFVATRFPVLAAGYIAAVLVGFQPGTVRFKPSGTVLGNLPARWDAQWYAKIAEDGYRWDGNPRRQQTVVFFPAMPLLMRVTAPLVGRHLLLAGVLLSLAAFLGALVYLFRFARDRCGPEAATAAVWLIASYPFAVYYSAPYTEALFLLGALGAFYHFERSQWLHAGLWGVLVGLSRPNGFLLAVPLGWLLLVRSWRERRLALGPALAVVGPVAGLALYSAHLWLRFGDALAWSKGQQAWGRTFVGVWDGAAALVTERWTFIAQHGFAAYTVQRPVDLLNSLAALFALALVWPVARRLGLAYAGFVVAVVVPPLLVGGTMSVGRFTAPLFPLFVYLGAAIPARHRPAWIAGFAVLQGLIAVLFFTWRPMF